QITAPAGCRYVTGLCSRAARRRTQAVVYLRSPRNSRRGVRCFFTFDMSLDRDSLGKVPTNSATPTTVPDPFWISAIRPLTRVSRDRNSQVFFLERIRLIQGS